MVFPSSPVRLNGSTLNSTPSISPTSRAALRGREFDRDFVEADGIVNPLRRQTLIKANLRGDIASQVSIEVEVP